MMTNKMMSHSEPPGRKPILTSQENEGINTNQLFA
jgi:hypothetical protein